MENNFTNEDFEDFLKRSADSMRMRPSAKVWEGIEGRIQKRRRRFLFATSAFVLLSSFLGYFLIDNSKEISRQLATTQPTEVNESNNQLTNALSSTTATEAKVIDIKTKRTSLATPALSNKPQNISNRGQISALDEMPLDVVEETPVSSFPTTVTDSEPFANNEQQEESITPADETTDNLLSIESITNAYKPSIKKSKIGFQVFFTPTVSYRKLSENKSYLRSVPQPGLINTPSAEEDVNDAVTHKPDMGLEFGVAAKYPITKNVNLRGGLQFNLNRYDIKAFKHSPEIAMIALNRGSNNGVDYIGAITDYRNFNGYRSDWLQNFYFQVSVPVGAELRLYSSKNSHFGIAGTIQPTYLMGERAYVLSSDYKNYSEVPSLTRRFNVNTAIETFVSYSTGRMQWQIGPQVRYQLLSSFVTKYPLKENLFDFGFKVGVSINKNTKEEPK